MAANLKLYARMLAHEQKRAIRVSTHQHVAIKEDALILNFLAMAGEGDTMHIVSLGRIDEAPEVRCVPDPRIRPQQHRLYRWLTDKLEAYFQWCLAHDTYPQIWTSGQMARHHLGHIADAIRWRHNEPRIQQLADYLSHLARRAEVAGQQTLMATSQVLADHFVTPQPPSDDEHLGLMLHWINPPSNTPIDEAISQVEQHPAGVKTRPDFDSTTLIPLVSAFNNARRTGAQQRGNALARDIRNVLEPIVLHIHHLVTQGIDILRDERLPILPDIEDIETQEAYEFRFFMSGLTSDARYRPTSTDSVNQAIYMLTKREHAQKSLETSLIRGDGFAREQARISGALVSGEVLDSEIVRINGQRRHHFNLHTEQHTLSVRPGDELSRLDEPRFVIRVESMQAHQTNGTILTCRIIKGQRVCGLPDCGTNLDLFGSFAQWRDLGKQMKQIQKRLSRNPSMRQNTQVHSDPSSAPTPQNLLNLVEDLS